MPADENNDTDGGDNTDPPATTNTRPFRFKHSADAEYRQKHRHAGSAEKRTRHRRHHHGRHKKRRLSSDHGPSVSSLPPDVAFRESLFDAMGDDEGAEFWHSVYGQPIHTYSRTYQDANTGELESMNDEQYAQYVRRKMWERSAEGVEAERESLRKEQKEREKRRKEEPPSTHNEPRTQTPADFTFDFEIEASLKRGQDRKDKKKWQQAWQSYLDKWKELQNLYDSRKGTPADDVEQIYLRNKIAWPVESGKRKDVCHDEVERFINKVSASEETESMNQESIKASILKSERIRWHPDKIQQRYGFLHIEQSTIEGVTAVFQIIDQMWTDKRRQNL